MKKITILSIALALSGCVSYQWVKPGQTTEQAQAALLQCKADAITKLPPNPQVSSNDAYKSHCDKNSDDKCSKDTAYRYQDANEDARQTLVEACMAKQGWKQIEVDD